MRILQEILEELAWDVELAGAENVTFSNLHLDSRMVVSGDAFVAIKGTAADGFDYISTAIRNGATVVFCERLPEDISPQVSYVVYSALKESMHELAIAFYGNATEELELIGITGTNGKTTVATMFFRLMRSMQVSCGLLSTVKICINEDEIPSKLTTPDVFSLYRYLGKMLDAGCKFVVMEVSSHAIHQGRIKGLQFAGAVFTNISHDHLDYHNTFKEYIHTKKILFDELNPYAFAIINIDDRNGRVMVQNSKANVVTYALKQSADYKAKVLEHDFSGMHLQIGTHDFYTRLVGNFNVYNILAVLAIAEQVGFDLLQVMTILSNVNTADGRFDMVRNDKESITGIVDYAHTPDALENVLSTIHKVNKNRGKIITVVGCGGDRDKAKRPLMAKVAVNYSDTVILTSDNPRTENPEDILDDMEKGTELAEKRKVLRISERKAAIQTAVSLARTHDVILIAGKGHEDYQEIQGERFPFDDKQILQEFLLE